MNTSRSASMLMFIASASMLFASPEEDYSRSMERVRKEYREAKVKALQIATKVELIGIHKHIRLFPEDDGLERIYMGNGMTSKIASKKNLKKDVSQSVLSALKKQLSLKPTTEINCYNSPCVGIRVYAGDKKVFECVVSTGGGSFLLRYPDHHVWADCDDSLMKLIQAQQVAAPDPSPSTTPQSDRE